jgi:predicted nucleic acid-binding protein
MYLVDINVISAGAPWKAVSAAELLKWMDDQSTRLYLSAVTVAEIEDAIAKARRERARRKAAVLTARLDTLTHLDRVLAFDVRAAARCRVGCRSLRAAKASLPASLTLSLEQQLVWLALRATQFVGSLEPSTVLIARKLSSTEVSQRYLCDG